MASTTARITLQDRTGDIWEQPNPEVDEWQTPDLCMTGWSREEIEREWGKVIEVQESRFVPVVGDLVTGTGVATGKDITGKFLGHHETRSTGTSRIEDPADEFSPWFVLTTSLRPGYASGGVS